jgi:hypothetical protein
MAVSLAYSLGRKFATNFIVISMCWNHIHC